MTVATFARAPQLRGGKSELRELPSAEEGQDGYCPDGVKRSGSVEWSASTLGKRGVAITMAAET